MSGSESVTKLLVEWGDGDDGALARLMPLVYDELRLIARRFLLRERPDHTLQPTALVNEVYLRLVGQERASWQNRAQFLGVAAQLMRRILIDHAKARQAAKRGGRNLRVSLSQATPVATVRQDADLLALDDVLTRLAELDPRQARLVELRYFGGLSIKETAHVLDISPATVKRDWVSAKAWLFRELAGALRRDS